jgi:hypothetical protein
MKRAGGDAGPDRSLLAVRYWPLLGAGFSGAGAGVVDSGAGVAELGAGVAELGAGAFMSPLVVAGAVASGVAGVVVLLGVVEFRLVLALGALLLAPMRAFASD